MKKLKDKIEKLGYSFKKEATIFLILTTLLLLIISAIFIYLKQFFVLVIGLTLLIIFPIAYFYKYVNKDEYLNRKKVNDFINAFSFFRIYILNGDSVYQALNKTIEFANDEIKSLLEGLVLEINEDKTVTPFINFSHNFESKLVEEIMISTYEMIDNGNNSNYLNQFTNIFENFKNRINKENEEKRFNKFDKYCNSSLVGSGLIMIIILFGILNLLGEMLWARN